jgi:uncharacterized membrane protein
MGDMSDSGSTKKPASSQLEKARLRKPRQFLAKRSSSQAEAKLQERNVRPEPQTSLAICALTGQAKPRRELVALDTLRPKLAARILADHPDIDPGAMISHDEAVRYRRLYAEELLQQERGELSALERDVARSLESEMLVSDNIELTFSEQRTLGQRMADGLSSFGGSWVFISVFAVFLVIWMLISILQGRGSFDPYPFILLNLILSCLAAIQAPIIMMSQKRQEVKDRLRAQNDYRINLKAELEIRHLHEKLDHLLSRQWERLAEFQQLQIEIMEENAKRASP